MNDQERGVYRKYQVERLNDPDGKHDECAYFVLDPRHDPIARVALDAYWQEARKQGYEALAVDIREWVTAERLNESASLGYPVRDTVPSGLQPSDPRRAERRDGTSPKVYRCRWCGRRVTGILGWFHRPDRCKERP